MKNYTDDQLVLITTGSQGESMAALSRMAASIHRKVQINREIQLYLVQHQFREMRKLYQRLLMNFI